MGLEVGGAHGARHEREDNMAGVDGAGDGVAEPQGTGWLQSVFPPPPVIHDGQFTSWIKKCSRDQSQYKGSH